MNSEELYNFIEELYEFYNIECHFRIIKLIFLKDNKIDYIARFVSDSDFDINNKIFTLNKAIIEVNELKMKKRNIDYKIVILHEFCHFYQLVNYMHFPKRTHDQIFFNIGNKYNPNFENIERSALRLYSNEEYRDYNSKLLNKLFKNKEYLNISSYLYHYDLNPIDLAQYKDKLKKIRYNVKKSIK